MASALRVNAWRNAKSEEMAISRRTGWSLMTRGLICLRPIALHVQVSFLTAVKTDLVGLRLNNEIAKEDRLENLDPGSLLRLWNFRRAKENVVFAINAVAKAYRRVLVRKSDWVQAYKTSSSSQTIWLNRTGTFGVASAAYWWSRLMGLIGRFGLNVIQNDWMFVLIFVDDLHIAAGGVHRWRSI